MADLVVPEEACAAEGEEKEVQNDPQREGREEDAEDDKGLLDELLSGASEDDAYDPEEDALAQEPEVSVRLSSREGSDSGSGGRENGDRDAREDGGMRRQDRNLAVRAGGEGDSAERRASDAGYPRERRERELGGRASTSMLHPAASAKAPKKFPFRALVVGIEGGLSWLDRAVLTRHFSKFGQVLDVFIPHSKRPQEQGPGDFQAHADSWPRERDRQGERDREPLRRREHSPREELRRRENRDQGLRVRGWQDRDHRDRRDEDRDRDRHARDEVARDVGRERMEVRGGAARRVGTAETHGVAEKGAVEDGRVMLGDNLLRVDSFNCVGVHRDDIKSRVIGPPNTHVTLEFMRPGQDAFQVQVRRMPARAAASRGDRARTHAADVCESSAAKRPRIGADHDTARRADREGEMDQTRTQTHRRESSAVADQTSGGERRSEVREAAPAQTPKEDLQRQVHQHGEESRSAETRHDSPAAEGRRNGPSMSGSTGARNAQDVGHLQKVDDTSSEREKTAGRADMDNTRASKRPRTHSPHSHSPVVVRDSGGAGEEERPHKSSDLELVISQAMTLKDLQNGLLSPVEGSDRDDLGLQGPMWAREARVDLVLVAMRQLLVIKQSQNEMGSVVEEIEVKMLRSLVRCLASKCEELHDLHSVLLAVNLLVALDYFELCTEKDKTDSRALIKGLVKVLSVKMLSRMDSNLRAADLVKIFVAFSGAGRDAGGALLDRASGYAILRRAENLLGGMEPEMLVRFAESLHLLGSEVPEKLANVLCAELKRALRDNRLKVPGDTSLLKVVCGLRGLHSRKDLLQLLAEKMRGLFESMPSNLLAESVAILVPSDVTLVPDDLTIHTSVLSEIARVAQIRAQEGKLSSRQAADILWALCQLDWREERKGVAASLVDVAVECLPKDGDGDHLASIGWGSPYSPSAAEDEGITAASDPPFQALPNGAGVPPMTSDVSGVTIENETVAGSGTVLLQSDAEAGVPAPAAAGIDSSRAEESHSDLREQEQEKPDVFVHGDSEGSHQATQDSKMNCKLEAMADGGLGGLGAARLLWAMVKVGMIERAKAVFGRAESILKQGYLDLEPRELADLLWAVTSRDRGSTMQLTLGLSVQQHLCYAACLCVKGLVAGELTVTITGLMQGGRELPPELLGCALDRIREVRRDLSVRNCRGILTCLNDGLTNIGDEVDKERDGMPTSEPRILRVEQARGFKLKRRIVHEICQEFPYMADKHKPDAAALLALLMRSVSLFGVELSFEDGHNIARRTLEIYGGDRSRGRGAERSAGFDMEQLVHVLGGFVASGFFPEDAQARRDTGGVQRGDRERGPSANVVAILCDDLRGRVQGAKTSQSTSQSGHCDILARAVVAAAVGGAYGPHWNALEFLDRMSTKFQLPVSRAKSKSALSRSELLHALLEALSSEEIKLHATAGQLADVVCAFVLAEQSCGVGDLTHDGRLVAILQTACEKINDLKDARRSCALLCLLSSRLWLPSQRALGAVAAHVVAKCDTLSCRELGLAVHAIAVLNQKIVAGDFSKLARKAVCRLNGKPLRDWGLQLKGSGACPRHGPEGSMTGGKNDRDRVSGEGGESWLGSELELDTQAAGGELRQLLCTVSMVLWAQAVMSKYSRARADFFSPSSLRPRAKCADRSGQRACDVVGVAESGDESSIMGEGGAMQVDKKAPGEPEHELGQSYDVATNSTAQGSHVPAVRPAAEAILIAKVCHVFALCVNDGNATSEVLESPLAGNSCESSARVDAADAIMGVQVLLRLHEVFLGLDIAGKSSKEVAAVGGKGADKLVERCRLHCKRLYSTDQRRSAAERSSEYMAEICAASADLGVSLEQDIVDDATAVMIPAGNIQQRVVVDVLQEQDVVDAPDTGTPLLKGRRCLQRRVLEVHGWRIVQLQQSSWALVRHNNVEKKKFLFRADRLRAYSSAPDWSQEGAMASALEAVDGCLSLLSFLEMVLCTHPEGLGALDALMITSCFRKMALPPYPSPPHKTAPGQGGGGGPQEFEARALQNADPSLKKRVEEMLSNSGLQARALTLVGELSFSDSAGVLVCIAQVWAALGSPRHVLQPALLSALCDQLAKELAPRMSSSAAERLALALFALAVPPSGLSELPMSALKAGVGAALARCREVSGTGAATSNGSSFLASLDSIAATALVNAAALLVPSSRLISAASTNSCRRGRLISVQEVWGTAADSWQRQPMGPDESLSLQVKALATRITSLVSSRSLSAHQVMLLIRCFARGTPRDASLLRSLVARLSEFVAADTQSAQGAASSGAGSEEGGAVLSARTQAPTLSGEDLLDVVMALVRHGFGTEVLPPPLAAQLKQPRFLSALSLDDLLSLLWSVAWGAFWDDDLWAQLVRRLHTVDFENEGAGELAGANAGSDQNGEGLLKVQRDIILLWAVAAAGRLHARSRGVSHSAIQPLEPSSDAATAGHGKWTAEEGELCRGSLARIVTMWSAKVFEIRKSAIAPMSSKLLPDAHTDMLRQALRALRFLEPDGSGAKFRRTVSPAKGRGHMQRFLEDEICKTAVLELEKLVLLRGAQLDQLRCKSSSDLRQDVHSVLSSLGHRVTIEDETDFKREPSLHSSHETNAQDMDRTASSKAGWLLVPTSSILVNIYGRSDYIDLLQPVDPFSPHLTYTSTPSAGSSAAVGLLTPAADAAAGVALRKLNVRWRIWEEQMKTVHGYHVVPVAADVWQDCQEDAAHVAALGLGGNDTCALELPSRRTYLQQLLEQVSAASCSHVRSSAAGAVGGVNGLEVTDDASPGMGGGEQGELQQDDEHDMDAMSPDSEAGDLPGLGADLPTEMEDDDGMNGGAPGAGEAAKHGRGKGKDKSHSTASKKGGKRLWKVEFSKSKQRWYYFNSKTRERLWKPPEVEGWVIKTGSGKHRPYLGLKHYYYNTQSKKSSYEPPILREK